ncbi:multidrug resistance protein 4 [Russula earlei]|uniref:Multidrug resistance protein 4 n=1 Tax=Russula earlei TaxID=71964 RepID=A0ACC0UNV9_9AGAM|nr:multidrug resistance protein 4 [Russula earlei]
MSSVIDPTDQSKVLADDLWALDARNPRNWPRSKKWAAVSVVSMYTIVAAIVSSMMAPALPNIAEQFRIVSETEIALTLSIFLLSFAISPLFYAPLSEMYGRIWVLHINNMLFVMFNLGCAFAPSKAILLGFRFLCGWAGGAPIAIGGGVVGDVFAAEDRALAMAIYTLGPVVAPAIGPAIGGFMSETVGWRYLFVFVAGLSAVASVVGVLLYRETYAPAIRLRFAKEAGDHLLTNLRRPFILLTRSVICLTLSGIYYLMFATFPGLFNDVYHFRTGVSGLAYLGVGIGFSVATAMGGHYGNKVYHALAARNGGQGKPEMRVPAILFGAFIVPIGLFWYGWSAEAKIHWIMPIIGTGIFGFGAMLTFLPIHLYLVDTFTYAASALSAASVTRSMLAFAFPLFGTQMFDALGLGPGNSLLAALAIVMGVPFPIWIWFYGERLRAQSSLTR